MSELQRRVSSPASRLVTIFVSSILLLVATAPLALARNVTLFGPKTYVRETGKPATFSDTFQVPANASDCRISIVGQDGGPLAANNVSVKVNGVEMADAADLRAGSGQKQQEVVLTPANIIVVTLKGKPGDAVTVEVVGVIPDLPPRPTPPPAPAPGTLPPPMPMPLPQPAPMPPR